MNTIVAIGKGGSTKSTTLANLAVIARIQGQRVGILDCDSQGSLSEWRHARGTADIPLRACRPDQLEEALRAGRRASLDYLFTDMSPDIGRHTLVAIRAADLVLLPMRPALFDIGVTQRRIDLVRSVGRPFAVVISAAPPRREGVESPMVRDARDALRSIGARLWRGQITHRNAVPNALIGGQAVAETEPFGPAAAEYTALWNAIVQDVSTQRVSA